MTDVVTKATARLLPADEPEAEHGAFQVILSTPAKDRDGENVATDSWEQPLPKHITFDVDHGMSVEKTVGSGSPRIESDGTLRVDGTYASTPLAQQTRALVNEGHIRTVSVAFLRKSEPVKGGKPKVTRELLNGAFVSVPANPEALVLASKAGRRNAATDQEHIQNAHDEMVAAGADCGSYGKAVKAVSDKPWSSFSQADYTIEQWRRACLIGPSTPSDSKGDYHLPVREPDGTVNRNAVHAAAGRLGQTQAAPAQIAKAKTALRGLYKQLGEDLPDSLKAVKAVEDDDTDPGELAQAVDAAIDEAMSLVDGIDLTSLPEPVAQALALLQAADVASDQLLDALGVSDPDEDDSTASSAAAAPKSAALAADSDAAAAELATEMAVRTAGLRILNRRMT